MANDSGTKMFTVDKFLGINEAADGYTELKMGQASRMVNWKVTDGYNITVRPGIRRIDPEKTRSPAPILASWAGFVGETEYLVIVDFSGGTDRIWMYQREEDGTHTVHHTQSGALGLTSAENAYVKIFAFSGKLYVMSSGNAVSYSGGQFTVEEPYIPLVITGASPEGGGTPLEGINLLSRYRRIDYSADGTATAYKLPEEATGVAKIMIDNTPQSLEGAGSFDNESRVFTFLSPPEKGVGNVEFTYETDAEEAEKNRMRIVKMTLTEAYNGSSDTRLFVAGDGSNVCFYTGLPQSGEVTALYFPGMNEVAVDMSDSPVTGLVKHYGKLLVFKPDGAYTITYEPVTLTDGSIIAGFYLRSASREFGHEALGQIQTVDNYPRTIFGGAIYEWRITSSFYKDERNAKRVSDAVMRSMERADPSRIVTCDDSDQKTYYVFLNDSEGTVLVNRYALQGDIWCIYKSELCRNVTAAWKVWNRMVFLSDSEAFFFDEDTATDAAPLGKSEASAIPAVWESGYHSFGADFRRKYSSRIYVSALPEISSELTVTARTDKRAEYMEKTVKTNVFTWPGANFADWTFDTNNTPKIRRLQLKVKKFVYYKLIFKVTGIGKRATVLGYDQQVRFSSMAK